MGARGGGGVLKVGLDRGKLQTLHPLFDLFDTVIGNLLVTGEQLFENPNNIYM